MGCIASFLYGMLQFCVLVLMTVGTPLDQFRPRTVAEPDINEFFSNSFCITLWGEKDKCFALSYDKRPPVTWSGCDGRVERFTAAETCAVISIVIFAAACIIGSMQTCCCGCLKWLCMLLNIAGVVTAGITWACMIDCYYRAMGSTLSAGGDPCVKMEEYKGPNNAYPSGMKFGAGLILIITAWCVNVVNIFILLLPC